MFVFFRDKLVISHAKRDFIKITIMKQFLSFLLLIVLLTGCRQKDVYLPDPIPGYEPTAEKSTHLTFDAAKDSLESILRSLSIQSTRANKGQIPQIAEGYSTQKLVSRSTSGENVDSNYVYVFNFKDNGGYAIMSNDTRLGPLLAITETGQLKKDSVINNPGFILFLEYTDASYNVLAKQGIPNHRIKDSVVYSPWSEEDIDLPEGPCKVQWGQGYPYNNFTPVMENGGHAPTGCVATAVAQIMSVCKDPASYQDLTFNWDAMNQGQDFYSVAKLMSALGTADNLNMQYKTNASSATISDIPRTFAHFGYSSSGQEVDYSYGAVLSEIRQGAPVLVSGSDLYKKHYVLGFEVSTDYLGHCWLIDGARELIRTMTDYSIYGKVEGISYEKKYYLHCNFGWSGNFDGYYYDGVFNHLKLITGIRK